ncbi:MAG TPA: head-tail connector protein [Chloroflexota bacterium]|nr:head-tail connector protein [Chloroflexota bacterium]
MSFLQIESPPAAEPVLLAEAKSHLRVSFDDPGNDALITEYIQAAREVVEGFTGKSYITKGYIQVHDNFPQYTDSVFSSREFPADYYAQGRYTSNYWNRSQQIKLFRSPLIRCDRIAYTSAVDQTEQNLYPSPQGGKRKPSTSSAIVSSIPM